ncbi:MAG TPA: hypothetical protein VOA87_17845 [Thermoanaerobaculia bacterium]|nr:hypothetical protein [Thermoanaerobaculia bacterium]
MALLQANAQALKQSGGFVLAVEVRDGSGFEVKELQQEAFKVWLVRNIGEIVEMEISGFWEVAESVEVSGFWEADSAVTGIKELQGLYLLSLPIHSDDSSYSLFSVVVKGHTAIGARVTPTASCLVTVANRM